MDGNPLSTKHFQVLDATIKEEELEQLVKLQILKRVSYLYEIVNETAETEEEQLLLSLRDGDTLNYDKLKVNREIRKRGYNVADTLREMEAKNVIRCVETRYDFKNTKISTGLAGVNRIFLPTSKIYPTLVASDTNDFITTLQINAENIEDFRADFLEEVYKAGNYRKITKSEACRIQGFPDDFRLPATRQRWMKLIGNSVAVPVIKLLAQAIIDTGVFAANHHITTEEKNTIRTSMLNHSIRRTYQRRGIQTELFQL